MPSTADAHETSPTFSRTALRLVIQRRTDSTRADSHRSCTLARRKRPLVTQLARLVLSSVSR